MRQTALSFNKNTEPCILRISHAGLHLSSVVTLRYVLFVIKYCMADSIRYLFVTLSWWKQLLQKAILLWLPDPATRDAMILRQALSGDYIDLTAATEIICSRTPSQLQTIKQIYHGRFGSYLEHDVSYHTSGDHQKVPFLCFSESFIYFLFSSILIWIGKCLTY